MGQGLQSVILQPPSLCQVILSGSTSCFFWLTPSHLGNCIGTRVLVDPWLIGPLDFGGGSHLLYQGTKRALRFTEASAIELARSCDLILITQSINDHCHKPTLAVLPRDIPVVAAPGAATIVQGMGYTSVQACDHGQSVEVGFLRGMHSFGWSVDFGCMRESCSRSIRIPGYSQYNYSSHQPPSSFLSRVRLPGGG